jgi:hypothetical protein
MSGGELSVADVTRKRLAVLPRELLDLQPTDDPLRLWSEDGRLLGTARRTCIIRMRHHTS